MMWFTCITCPPHGQADHSLYGLKECLVPNCPCLTFRPNPEKPEKPPIHKPFSGNTIFNKR